MLCVSLPESSVFTAPDMNMKHIEVNLSDDSIRFLGNQPDTATPTHDGHTHTPLMSPDGLHMLLSHLWHL